jgi:hypothetical protein
VKLPPLPTLLFQVATGPRRQMMGCDPVGVAQFAPRSTALPPLMNFCRLAETDRSNYVLRQNTHLRGRRSDNWNRQASRSIAHSGRRCRPARPATGSCHFRARAHFEGRFCQAAGDQSKRGPICNYANRRRSSLQRHAVRRHHACRFPPPLRGLVGKTVGKMQHVLIIGDGAGQDA